MALGPPDARATRSGGAALDARTRCERWPSQYWSWEAGPDQESGPDRQLNSQSGALYL